jgi:hypothetical protein
MKEIQLKELHRCIKFIEGLGCHYRIIGPEGESFGDLEVVESKERTRGPLKYPYGSVAAWFRPLLNVNATIGEVQEVDCGTFEPAIVRSGICSDLSRRWGNETYTTAIVGNKVEIMRTA